MPWMPKPSKFTIMAVGSQGSGRSLLFNNLVARRIIKAQGTNEIDIYMLNLDSFGASRNVVLIETPGFCSGPDDKVVQDSIYGYIQDQLDRFIEEESKTRRNPAYEDTRIHCLLYIIPATGARLKYSDITFLRKVSKIVNIVPVITKADALGISERKAMQQNIRAQLDYYEIPIVEFNGAGDFDTAEAEGPFAVILADDCDKEHRIRKHISGTIDVDSPEFSDLSLLRNALFGDYMEMLVEKTICDIYEKYRTNALESVIKQKSK